MFLPPFPITAPAFWEYIEYILKTENITHKWENINYGTAINRQEKITINVQKSTMTV